MRIDTANKLSIRASAYQATAFTQALPLTHGEYSFLLDQEAGIDDFPEGLQIP